MKGKKTFEQAMERLEEVTALLSDSETPLDRSLELFAEASELIGFCEGKLSDAQLTIEKLTGSLPEDATNYETDGR